MAPRAGHRPRPRGDNRDSLSVRLPRCAPRPRVRGILLPRRRRKHVPGQDTPWLGGILVVAEPLDHRVEPVGLPVHVLDRPGTPLTVPERAATLKLPLVGGSSGV